MRDDRAVADRVQEATAAIRRESELRPALAIILGSGLGSLATGLADPVAIPYAHIPHFPVSTAPGHAGRLLLGHLSGVPIVAMSGRGHLYEGYAASQVAFPVRVMRQLGASILIVTNAAGAVNRSLHPGALMLIRDHINLTGQNPLVGPHDPRLGRRFPDMSEAYSRRLRDIARTVAGERGIELAEGVYLALLGPTYETPAEIRMAATLGADAVGMSTVAEVIVANQCGMEVLGISCITNMAAGILDQRLSEEEVIETATRIQPQFVSLIRDTVAALRDAAS